MAKDVVGAGDEKPKSERQARCGVPFVISMFVYNPMQKLKLISVQSMKDTPLAVWTHPFQVPVDNLFLVEVP